jgi:hypothetical protein
MSAYEWVIEQDSPDGITTRIVFDFGDDNDGTTHSNIDNSNGSRYSASSLLHQRVRGSRGGRGSATAYSQSTAATQLQTQADMIGSTGNSALLAYKDSTTRSDGGSSKRSSKRSNGSRPRRHHHHRKHHSQLGSSGSGGGAGGGSSGGNGSMLSAAGSAYTSAALRQRYHRMLFGERGGYSNANGNTSAPVATRPDSSGGALNTVNFYSKSSGLSNSNCSPASPPPSTIFMSTYGAEPAEDEERSSGSYLARRSRTSTNSSGTNQGVEASYADANPKRELTVTTTAAAVASPLSWAAFTANSVPSPTGVGPAATSTPFPREASESPTRSSVQPSDTSAIDYVDDDNRYCRYVKRDVWASRSACPRTVLPSASDFPAFPPLHPIPLDDENTDGHSDGEGGVRECTQSRAAEGNAQAGACTYRSNQSPSIAVPNGYSATVQGVCPAAAQQPFRVVSGPRDCFDGVSSGVRGFTSVREGSATAAVSRAVIDAAVADGARRYNKMLLRKERQRGRGRGWQATSAVQAWSGDGCRCSSRGRGGGIAAGASARTGATQRRRSNGCGNHHGDGLRSRCGRCGGGEEDVSCSSSSLISDDADVDADSDDTNDTSSSIECLSNDASSDDSDAEALRTDASFAATVQALAKLAGRERRKMEAHEERQLQNELSRCEEALMTPPMSRAVPELSSSSLAAALRQRDEGVVMGNRPRLGCNSSRSSNDGGTPSSFFISPIHQSVAAEAAPWSGAGTRFRFLGQGGLSSVNTGRVASGRGGMHNGGSSRRRGRPDDNEEEEKAEGDDASVATTAAETKRGAPSRAPPSSQMRRPRKRRKKGDEARQSVMPECGGSRALRPVAPPSIAPPVELLPCSKKEMCEDMLESFLMAVVLEDDDDLKLL